MTVFPILLIYVTVNMVGRRKSTAITHISVCSITELPPDKIDRKILFFSMEGAYKKITPWS
jgi:hypothetical protein